MRDFLAFRRMITPVVIQIVFWIGVAACVVAAAIFMLGAFTPGTLGAPGYRSADQAATGQLIDLAGGLAILIFGPIAIRIYCELLILMFRMNETLTDIRDGLVPSPR